MAKRATKKDDFELLAALKHVAIAQHETGAPNQVHCRMSGNAIIAYDGVLAAGVYLSETVPMACPNTLQLVKAMERANDVSAMSFDNSNIIIKTNKFKAIVPCIQYHDLMFIDPDHASYQLTNDFREAATNAAIFTKENAQTVVAASIMLRNGSCVGTNGRALIEVWHGNPMPSGLIVPKTFIDALGKTKKDIVSFGYTDTTLTIWFEDKSWIKSQLYSEPWPNIDLFLSYTEIAQPQDIPKEFWQAIKTVSAFSEDGRIYMHDDFVTSHTSSAVGAEYKVKGVPHQQSYDYKMLMALEPYAQKFDWTGNERVVSFFGEKLRGVISRSSY